MIVKRSEDVFSDTAEEGEISGIGHGRLTLRKVSEFRIMSTHQSIKMLQDLDS